MRVPDDLFLDEAEVGPLLSTATVDVYICEYGAADCALAKALVCTARCVLVNTIVTISRTALSCTPWLL